MTLTKKDLAVALGVNVRTITTWVQEGCPSQAGDRGEERRFVLEDVRRWAAARGVGRRRPAATPPPPAPPASAPRPRPPADDESASPAIPGFRDVGSRDTRMRAQTAKDLLAAKRREHDLQQEKGLKDLGLDLRIREAKTPQELFEITREVSAVVSNGSMPTARGNVLRQLLAGTGRALTDATPDEPQSAAVFLVTEQARRLADTLDKLVNGWRRRWIEEALDLHLAADRAELPDQAPDDDGYPLTPRLEQLGLDRYAEPQGERPGYCPAPVVPPAAPLPAAGASS